MPTLTFLQALAVYFTSFTIVAAGIVWLSKILITKFLDAGVEKFKANLQYDLESHKSKLQLQYQKNNKLHDAQCLAINTIYKTHLEYTERILDYNRFVTKEQYSKEDLSADHLKTAMLPVAEIGKKSLYYIYENRILLSEELFYTTYAANSLLNKAAEKLHDALMMKIDHNNTEYIDPENGNIKFKSFPELDKLLREAEQILFNDIKPHFEQLVAGFRKIYGSSQEAPVE